MVRAPRCVSETVARCGTDTTAKDVAANDLGMITTVSLTGHLRYDNWPRAPSGERLENISAAGALVETDLEPLPPPDTPIMFRLVSNVTDWVMRAKVVGITTCRTERRFPLRSKKGPVRFQLRIAFTEPCPYEFFKASISGFVVERSPAGKVDSRGYR